MKIIPPPHIADLDELLDVVLHPEKLTERLSALKTMRDAIIDTLETVQTKAQADDYLAQATQTVKEAETMRQHALDDREVADEEIAHLKAQHEAERAAQAARDQETQRRLTQQQQALEQRERAMATAQANLAKQEADLLAGQQSLQQQKDALRKEYEKIEKAKEALVAFN